MIDKYFCYFHKLLASEKIPFNDVDLHRKLPKESGVYRIFEKKSEWNKSIYLGKTGNLLQRIYHNHLMGDKQASSVKRKLIANFGLRDEKAVKDYLKRRCSLQFIVIKNRNEIKFVEHFLISILRPKYND
ncbi:MAG: hypothetical protein KAW02_06880 [candidate division Zixibacteria bacterium]|nr:hypothetical protein [candidate division Zixibacteria bacterium]MCK4427925.1 hypothetical protein [candidate division Zixibacteria bacterium]